MRVMPRRLGGVFFGSALLIALSAHGAAMYRWVDESGRTHVSDVVPDKYRKSAIRIDSRSSELSPEQRRQAEQAAARNKALAEEAVARGTAAPPAPPQAMASRPVVPKRPARGVTDATDCDTWRALYRESQECFGPFRTVNGATKAEAFEHCNPIPSPELKCGPLRD